MDTFLTILLWLGSGFAFAVGVFCGAGLMCFSMKEKGKGTEETIDLLRERNEIDERIARSMERIANASEIKVAN